MKRKDRLEKIMREISLVIMDNLTNEEKYHVFSGRLKNPFQMLQGVIKKLLSD